MPYLQIFIIGLGLSADAFAVSVTNGLSFKEISRIDALKIAASFGIFQAVMPLIGFLLGTVFEVFIKSVDHYVALIFLGFIGAKMLFDELFKKSKSSEAVSIPFNSLIAQAVATSIDALVAGVVFISMGIEGFGILPCIAIIGITTFVLSFMGVFLGKRFGVLLGGRAKILGGIILIGIGLKIFLEHTLM
ncbi:MAG: manganese efflux pump MntP family protein [Oscillospiraceae bacterium]|nr:manganese efflux pump MntP family protein [Oscillospiraceae bacterium]